MAACVICLPVELGARHWDLLTRRIWAHEQCETTGVGVGDETVLLIPAARRGLCIATLIRWFKVRGERTEEWHVGTSKVQSTTPGFKWH